VSGLLFPDLFLATDITELQLWTETDPGLDTFSQIQKQILRLIEFITDGPRQVFVPVVLLFLR